MKIVATMEENTPINIKRYDNEFLVGERNVALVDYCYSLISQLPIGALFKYFGESEAEIKDYLSNLEDKGNFTAFMHGMIQSAPKHWFENDQAILQMGHAFVERLPSLAMDSPGIAKLLIAIAKAVPTISFDTDHYALFLELLKKIISKKDSKMSDEVSRVVYSNIIGLLNLEETQSVKDAIENLIPHLDQYWFSKMVLEVQSKSKKPISFYSGRMPKNVDYIHVTSKGTSFIYDVPRQLVETTFQGSKLGKIGYPRLLFVYTLGSDNLVHTMRIFAAKEETILDPLTTLYEFPYSHVSHGTSGRVCWNFSDITFEMMPTAHELFLSANNSTHSRGNVFDLFIEQKEQPYDESKLLIVGTLGNVL